MQDAFGHCEARVREADRSLFLSALFAPPERRGALYALYAFAAELASIRDLIKEPMAGEIRLQWWREALAGERPGEAQGHPVAAALIGTIEKYDLPLAPFEALIEARRFDFSGEAMQGIEEVERYARDTVSTVVELAARMLGGDAAALDFAGPAGVSMGLVGLLRRFPHDVRRGRLFLPADTLARHTLSSQDLFAGQSSDGLIAVLADMRETAARHYREAR